MATFRELLPKIKDDMKKHVVSAGIELANRVHFDTPVDTGLLSESWVATLNGYAEGTTGDGWESLWPTMELGDTLNLINRQPYVRVIEYTAHSAQAPDGMMWKNIANWQGINNLQAVG